MATRMRAKVVDRDRGFAKLRKTLESIRAGNTYVKVGYVGPAAAETNEDGLTMAALGQIHEFGAPSRNIPERSHLRSTFDAKRSEYVEFVGKLLGRVVDGKLHVDKALGMFGAKASGDVKQRVLKGPGIPPENAPSVKARKEAKRRKGSKGSVRTLVDTGRMIASLTYEVVGLGGKSK